MGAFRVAHRKVGRTFRQIPRRASPTRKARSSAPRATAPIVALARNPQAKAGAKGAYGVALAASLVIHAGVALGCLFWGTATDATPMPSAIPVDILTPPPATQPGEVKPAAARVVAPSTRPRSKCRHRRVLKLSTWLLPRRRRLPWLPLMPNPRPEHCPKPQARARRPGPFPSCQEPRRRCRPSSRPVPLTRAPLEKLCDDCARPQQGTTRLRFCIGDKGEPRAAEVVNSSGSALLDSAAVDCVLPSAMPFPAISRPCVTVPVRFELQR